MFLKKNTKLKPQIIFCLAYAILNEMNGMALAFEFHRGKIKQALNEF